MWRNRTGVSCCDILHFGLLDDPLAEIRTEELGRVQVHFPPQQFGEFLLHGKERQPRHVAWPKLHEHIEIAVGTGVTMQRRAKHGEFADMMPPAKLRDLRRRQLDV